MCKTTYVSDNSPIQGYLGGGNKIVSISVTKLWLLTPRERFFPFRPGGSYQTAPQPRMNWPGQNLGQVLDDPRPRSHVFTAAARRELGTVSPFIRFVRA